MENVRELTKPCTWTWTPYTDQIQENTFVNFYDGQAMPDLPWKAGNPNLGRAANNVLLFSDDHKQ